MQNATATILTAALRERFNIEYTRRRFILFSAPCGCGKTVAAHELLMGKNAAFRTVGDNDFFAPAAPDKEVVVLDDLQLLREKEEQLALCDLLRSNQDKKILLLSRGKTPGYLMPFQFSGLLESFDITDFLLGRDDTEKLLLSYGVEVSAHELSAIERDIKGYPLALTILARCMADGQKYGSVMFEAAKRELFVYFDEAVFNRFDKPLRSLLMDMSPFEYFTAEMAKLIKGDSATGELLARLQRETSMLRVHGSERFQIFPIFREFLAWKMSQEYTSGQTQMLYSRAGLYYELQGDIPHALYCFSQAGDREKVPALLEKHAELHPGIGYYYEMEPYYLALPQYVINSSPTLMSGMCMLSALTTDFEQSELWYRQLQEYAARLKRSDAEYKEVRGKLAYLDIALPQRGSGGLFDLINSAYKMLSNRELIMPALSVTSTLPSIMNGGKDFCSWSKKDDLLYVTMRKAVETVLGRDGVGLADCAICESGFEKGENISSKLLDLMARLNEIQNRGTPDIEFAVVGLLARDQMQRGNAQSAVNTLQALRERFESAGQTRFLPNMDAMLCRFHLRLGDTNWVERWHSENAPRDGLRIRALWRYQYIALAMVQIAAADYDGALLTIAPLQNYCKTCERTMDLIYSQLLTAICHFRTENTMWQEELCAVLDKTCEYRFVTPLSELGAAILPMLTECTWKKNEAYLKKLIAAARTQAVFYPRFLKCASTLAQPLTAAEMQVLRLLCSDLSNQEICEILDIKLPTVKSHVSHILQKLSVSRRSEAKTAAQQQHLI